MVKRIAILTSGGDAPGMNAAIRLCIRAGLYYGKEMYVIYEGFKGLVEGQIHQVTKDFTKDLINRGGTILKSARYMEFIEEDVQKKAIEQLQAYDIDALIGIGGDGTYKGLLALAKLGFPVIGIPATIDNDVSSSERTIGFSTALNTICECVDRIKDTSNSHQRCSIVEVMGRYCGDLALYAGVSEGAELTITSDTKKTDDEIIASLKRLKAQRKTHAIVLVSEHLYDGAALAKKIEEETGFHTCYEVLGRLQRGGSPTAEDRILAARLSVKAIELLVNNEYGNGRVVGQIQGAIKDFDIEEAIAKPRHKHINLEKLINMLQ